MSVVLHKNIHIGDIPSTPAQPYFKSSLLYRAEQSLLQYASKFGHPISYVQEQAGALIQNIIPCHKTEWQQISTSSKVQLALHTEAAFHPYKPDYVMLLCLRGDPTAVTTYANVEDIVSQLSGEIIQYLKNSAFTIGVDQSFKLPGKSYRLTTSHLLKEETRGEYSMIYDEDLMKPVNILASMAIDKFGEAVSNCVQEIVLETGDLLIIDNNKTIHGRKPFQPKYDGTDRWVQRMLVRKNLPPEDQLNGHIVTTSFEE